MSAAKQPDADIATLGERMRALEDWREDIEPRLRVVEKEVPTQKQKEDTEARIRALEKWFFRAAGAITVLTFLASIAGAAIAKYLGGK